MFDLQSLREQLSDIHLNSGTLYAPSIEAQELAELIDELEREECDAETSRLMESISRR